VGNIEEQNLIKIYNQRFQQLGLAAKVLKNAICCPPFID
jgi:hypothetical protein